MKYFKLNRQPVPVKHTEIGLQIELVFKNIECCTEKVSANQIGNLTSLQNLYLEVIRLERLLTQVISLIGEQKNLSKDSIVPAESIKDVNLTGKELEILAFFVKGLTYKETAEVLQCKVSTVQTHIKQIYRKLGVHSRAEAVYEAIQMHMIDL